jgi:hypothetical protein
MTLTNLTYIVLELNSALDTGKYDGVNVIEAQEHIESRDLIPWLQGRVPDMDLSLLSAEASAQYEDGLNDILGGYAGAERRKWGVQHRGLCLLIAWTNELIQRRAFSEG